MFTTKPTAIPDVLELIPTTFPDERGYFFESYNQQEFERCGISVAFVQDNVSNSKKGVLRGLHFQTGEFAQDKLVSVATGKVFDVVVDIRKESPTYGKWVGVTLDEASHNMLFIPKGCAHGFYVLSEQAKFYYKCSNFYNKEASSGIRFDDPTLAIQWPLEGEPIVSEQDKNLPLFTVTS